MKPNWSTVCRIRTWSRGVSDPADGRAALVGITDAGRALLADRRQERHKRLADLLAALPAADEPALALAMHVALPIVRRLSTTPHRPATPTGPARPEGRDGNETGAHRAGRAAP